MSHVFLCYFEFKCLVTWQPEHVIEQRHFSWLCNNESWYRYVTLVSTTKAEVTWSGRFVCRSVIRLCVCVQHYSKSNQLIGLISLKLGIMIGLTSRKNCFTFGDDLAQDRNSGSLFHFPCCYGIGDFRRFISIYHTSLADFHNSLWIDWCQQGNESVTFWEQSERHSDQNPD